MQSYPTKRSTRVYGRSSLSPLFFCNSSLFFYPGGVHVAKSEIPPFQRTIPLYGSRNIWVAWLARLDFSSFPFPPPPFFGLAFYDPSKKTARTSTGTSTGNSRVEISNFPSLNTDIRIVLNWSLIYVRGNFFSVFCKILENLFYDSRQFNGLKLVINILKKMNEFYCWINIIYMPI